ncbi:sugar transferase [Mesorhizobium sp. M0410]|uniref:sugar transferase n=2 Tax=unclassified Mesorhizobium TaxID=325217 RepID=UPI003336C44F
MNIVMMNRPRQRHLVHRVRFQLLGGLAFAILLPALIRILVDPSLAYYTNLQITIFAGIVAHTIGYFSFRRIGNFPGIAASGYIFPTFALSYGFVYLVIFLARIEYSGFQAASSLTLSILWYFVLTIISRRLDPYSLAVVPGGAVGRLEEIGGVNWHWLVSPDMIIERVNGVVADLRADLSDDWERYIADRALAGVPVYHVKQITESLTGRVEIEHLSENTLGSINPNQAYIKIKQAIDWVCALSALVVLAPLLLLIALMIRLESPGPAIFRQERLGFGGKSFTVYKFRTMTVSEPEAANVRSLAVTKPGDSRVTRLGRFLRRSRIDELPQLINIVRSEMSWIGPRPEATVLSSHYSVALPFYRYRNIVRPGISGWAQVNQGYVSEDDDETEKLHYDFYYIKNFSPWLDFVIVLRTLKTLLSGFGSR